LKSLFDLKTNFYNKKGEKDHAIVKWLIDDKISVTPFTNLILNE
jgi:hypothetical protein